MKRYYIWFGYTIRGADRRGNWGCEGNRTVAANSASEAVAVYRYANPESVGHPIRATETPEPPTDPPYPDIDD